MVVVGVVVLDMSVVEAHFDDVVEVIQELADCTGQFVEVAAVRIASTVKLEHPASGSSMNTTVVAEDMTLAVVVVRMTLRERY